MKTILTILIFALSLNAFSQKKHPKVTSENVTKKNFMDRKTHPNSDIIEFTFADGISCTLVKKGDSWFNYNIRGESKEKKFDSKEAGLQKKWLDAVNTEAVGGAIAGAAIKNNKTQKVYDHQNTGLKKTPGGQSYQKVPGR